MSDSSSSTSSADAAPSSPLPNPTQFRAAQATYKRTPRMRTMSPYEATGGKQLAARSPPYPATRARAKMQKGKLPAPQPTYTMEPPDDDPEDDPDNEYRVKSKRRRRSTRRRRRTPTDSSDDSDDDSSSSYGTRFRDQDLVDDSDEEERGDQSRSPADRDNF